MTMVLLSVCRESPRPETWMVVVALKNDTFEDARPRIAMTLDTVGCSRV